MSFFTLKMVHNNVLYKVLKPAPWKKSLLKGPILGLRQYLAAESTLKITKNVFHIKSLICS